MRIKVADDRSVLPASIKLLISAGIGIVIGVAAATIMSPRYAPLVGWDSAIVVYLLATWPRLLGYDGKLVKSHALREDPSIGTSDLILIGASLASLAAVGLVLLQATASTGSAKVGEVVLGLGSVVLSWLLVHTVFALRYAEQYYRQAEPVIDFGGTKTPTYHDFAYVAFTIGMTYQVSDTTMKTRQLRQTVLKHAFLSYLFGTIIIAVTINLIASLGK